MSKNKRKQPAHTEPTTAKTSATATAPQFPWLLTVCAITAVAFFPMLANGFTNWDDQFYITENAMLPGPDWPAIFTRPLMANYHPLTVASLALNYQFSGLSPFSYHAVNWVLHIVNTGLVFYLADQLSGGNRRVSFITALLFGIHPMHVESVAWASERKDVLYTFFFLLSLLCYLRYLNRGGWKTYTGALALFTLSLLSKPAAVTLPVILLLTDWFRGRSLKAGIVWLEKAPFFALSIVFGFMALKYQQSVKAIVAPEIFPFWQKVVFSVYGFGEYVKRLFWPFPLSAIHPFPEAGVIPGSFYPAFILVLATAAVAWYYRKKKFVLYGIGFYAVNIALVLQLLTFGHAVIAERYSYVPYIGLAFGIAMAWADGTWSPAVKNVLLYAILLACFGFSAASFRQVQVWKNGQTLWTKAIETYPESYIARSNRGQFLSAKMGKFDEALKDYAVALQVVPNDSFSLINRATIYLNQQNYAAAFADADSLIKYVPAIARGHYFHAVAAERLGKPDMAFEDYTNCLRRDSLLAEAWSGRAVLRYNTRQDYAGAKEDFDHAIRLEPKQGLNYKNRARCWIKFGKKEEALRDLETAGQLGVKVGDDLLKAAQAL